MSGFYETYLNLLTEANISIKTFIPIIKDKKKLEITYDSDDPIGRGKRLLEPYVLGVTKAGNLCFRGYQSLGSTKTYVPEWKIFLLDKILTWKVVGDRTTPPPLKYNPKGDKSLSQILYQTPN